MENGMNGRFSSPELESAHDKSSSRLEFLFGNLFLDKNPGIIKSITHFGGVSNKQHMYP